MLASLERHAYPERFIDQEKHLAGTRLLIRESPYSQTVIEVKIVEWFPSGCVHLAYQSDSSLEPWLAPKQFEHIRIVDVLE